VTGDLRRAALDAHRTAELARALRLDTIFLCEHYALGCIYYAWDDLTRAKQHFTAVIDVRHKANAYALNASLQGLALIDQALGASLPAGPPMEHLLAPAPSVWAVDEETARAFDARLALAGGAWRPRAGGSRSSSRRGTVKPCCCSTRPS
jgi:hypothetical protein